MLTSPQPYRSTRRRRYRRRAARFRMLGWLLLATLITMVSVLVAELSLSDDLAPSGLMRRLSPEPAPASIGARPEVRYAGGPVFRHSVVAGGVRTSDELQAAIDSDPVVAAHHAGVSPGAMRPTTLSADRLVYMSYRRGDKVFWTKQRVLLRKGEAVLSDGESAIRARCGNGMSFDPLLPTEESGPNPEEFEQLVPVAPHLISRIFDSLGFTGGIPDSLLFPDPSGGSLGDPVGPVTPWFFWAPDAHSGNEDPVLSDFDDPLFPSDVSEALILSEVLDPGGDELPPIPGEDSIPALPPLIRLPPTGVTDPVPEDIPTILVDDPLEDAVPAPEPATLLMVGGGISALLARRRGRRAP